MILGINAFHPDASACALDADGLVAAVEEERYTRVKHWAGVPLESVGYCLEQGGLEDIAGCRALAVARKPRAYLARKALLTLRHPRSLGRALGRVRNLRAVRSLREVLGERLGVAEASMPELVGVEHHLAHVSSAFHCSPFEEAMCLTVDGFGDFVSTMMAVGRGNSIQILQRVLYPHSLGLFYTALTQFLGFPAYGDEYKVMGLAAQGEPSFSKHLNHVVREHRDGTFRLDLEYFRHVREGVDMTWDGGQPHLGRVFSDRLVDLLGAPRAQNAQVTQRHKDLAASVQDVYERHFLRMVRSLQARTGMEALCLAGGCAQNSLANGRLFEKTDIRRLYVQPAAADNGTALGAALFVNHSVLDRPRTFVMTHSYWGPEFGEQSVRAALAEQLPASTGEDGRFGNLVVRGEEDTQRLVRDTARAIARGDVVGWFQGRAEWGPRALGNRSILADPRRDDMREILNDKIKRREPFRPFAPSVLAERKADWFESDAGDVFMTQVAPIVKAQQSRVPAITHVDGTGRLQIVERDANPRYWRLIEAFEEETGVPMLLNTSFNENEPIVNGPSEALACFLRTRMDRIVLGDIVVERLNGTPDAITASLHTKGPA